MDYKIKEEIISRMCHELQDYEGDHDNVDVCRKLECKFEADNSDPLDGGITEVWLYDGWGSDFLFQFENKYFEQVI